jgi:hypothetical protein
MDGLERGLTSGLDGALGQDSDDFGGPLHVPLHHAVPPHQLFKGDLFVEGATSRGPLDEHTVHDQSLPGSHDYTQGGVG